MPNRIALAVALACTVGCSSSGPSPAPTVSPSSASPVNVLTQRYDLGRTGMNPAETTLTLANVNAAKFGKLYSYPVDGQVYAQPLYVAGIAVNGATRDVVYVATEHDSVYAFDATGQVTSPLWHVSFIDPPAVTTVPAADTGETRDITNEIGITSTPVIDLAAGTIYVVAKTKETSGDAASYVHRLHALDITTGQERRGSPVVISGSVQGATGLGADPATGVLAFDPFLELQRPALLLSRGTIYIAFGSHGGNGPYHGWLIGYDAATLQQTFVFNTTPNGQQGAIWSDGCGPGVDADGNVFVISGNGTFDAASGNYGDSYLKFSPAGALLDYFTPFDQDVLDAQDLDLGSGGPLLLPDQPGAHPHLIVNAGKEATLRVVDRDAMGRFQQGSDSQIVQSIPNAFPGGTFATGNFSTPLYWQGRVYFSAVADAVKMFELANGLLSTSPASRTALTFPYPGGIGSISSNGATNGILWVVERPSSTAPGVLHAYDATDLTKQLYDSNQAAGQRDQLDVPSKFMIPTVANGRVFLGTFSTLTVYGLLP